MLEHQGEARLVEFQIIGMRDHMTKPAQIPQRRQHRLLIERRTHPGNDNAEAMNQLRMPAALIINVILECLGNTETHLLDDVEKTHELVGAAFVAAGTALPQTIGGGICRLGGDAQVVLHLGTKGDQTYAIHGSPSVMILCLSRDSGRQTTSTGRRISSSSRAVRV